VLIPECLHVVLWKVSSSSQWTNPCLMIMRYGFCLYPRSCDFLHPYMLILFQVMENLETLTNLQELWLGRNRIRTVNLCGLKLIKKISLQSNRLTSMDGFQVEYYNTPCLLF
jgi:hypothetical protein